MIVLRVADIHVNGGLHHNRRRFQPILDLIAEIDPTVLAVEYDPPRFEEFVEDVLQNRNRCDPADIFLAIFAAKALDIPLALIDTGHTEAALAAEARYQREILPERIDETGRFQEANSLSAIDSDLRRLERRAPEAYRTLVRDRDRRMAGHLQALARRDERIVAVVGENHTVGLHSYLTNPGTLSDSCVELPPIRDPPRGAFTPWAARQLSRHPSMPNVTGDV
ncbi:TraB/GumN family protein [Halovivax sp.]|uniref:TraB/GumN family protein n=1 Tax=Halovivax sp. TaxID=1935978 RepID=UPI0025C0D9A5|nr:TraB/GumN family protein [Halovivax sp.]